jgi:hypothetical protein
MPEESVQLPILSQIDESEAVNDNRTTRQCGPVAQLGARFHGMEEVIGSIPIRSTNHPHLKFPVPVT